MKHLILIVISLTVSSTMVVYGQSLSPEGRSHFKAAMALFEIASSIADYEQVTAEFEKVTMTDPDYADTYIGTVV